MFSGVSFVRVEPHDVDVESLGGVGRVDICIAILRADQQFFSLLEAVGVAKQLDLDVVSVRSPPSMHMCDNRKRTTFALAPWWTA